MPRSIETRASFDCKRRIADVFDYISDFSRAQQWNTLVYSCEKVTDGPVESATAFKLKTVIGPYSTKVSYQISSYSAPNKVIFTGEGKDYTVIDTFVISKTKIGCHIDWHSEIELKGISTTLAPVLDWLIKSKNAKSARQLKVALKDNFKPPKVGKFQSLSEKLPLPAAMWFTRFSYLRAKRHWKPVTANIKNKHVVITGATAGLGLVVARRLAHLGAKLTIVAEDKGKAIKIAKQIKDFTGNTNITIRIANLSRMRHVASLADRLIEKDQRIDILINNTESRFTPAQVTKENIEKNFATHLLGPYLLTEKLHPLMTKAKAARVLNVIPGGIRVPKISISNLESDNGDYESDDALLRAKYALSITGEQLAQAWAIDKIAVHNVCPGWLDSPEAASAVPEFAKKTKYLIRNAQEASDTVIWLASATEAGKTSGAFWLDRKPRTTLLSGKAKNAFEQRIALREALEKYCKQYFTKPEDRQFWK